MDNRSLITDNQSSAIPAPENTPMTIAEAQNVVDNWIKTIGNGYFSELTNMVVLTEEVGELARVIARLYGDQIAKQGDLRKSLGEELADVLWVLLCLANQTGTDLTAALRESLRKKTLRDATRFTSSPTHSPASNSKF